MSSCTDDLDMCHGCTNRKDDKSCPSGGNKESDFVILGESPGEKEIELGSPFSKTGPTGSMVREEMRKNGINNIDAECFLINALNCDVNAECWRENNNQKKHDLTKDCIKRVECEIRQEERKVIVVLGGVARETIRKIYDLEYISFGNIYTLEGTIRIIFTHHPSRILREKCDEKEERLRKEFADHIKTAILIYNSL